MHDYTSKEESLPQVSNYLQPSDHIEAPFFPVKILFPSRIILVLVAQSIRILKEVQRLLVIQEEKS